MDANEYKDLCSELEAKRARIAELDGEVLDLLAKVYPLAVERVRLSQEGDNLSTRVSRGAQELKDKNPPRGLHPELFAGGLSMQARNVGEYVNNFAMRFVERKEGGWPFDLAALGDYAREKLTE